MRVVSATFSRPFLPAQRYASAVLAVILCLSVHLYVKVGVLQKMAKPRIEQTMLYDNPGTLFFYAKHFDEILTWSPLTGAKYRWGRLKAAILTNILLHLRNGAR